MLFGRKAQSTLEYALVIVAVVAALMAIQSYLRRTIQGKLRASSDQIGYHFEDGPGGNYTRITKFDSTTLTEEHHAEEHPRGAQTTISTDSQNFVYEESRWYAP